MPFGHPQRLKPKPNHIEGVMKVLSDGLPHSPKKIADASRLTLNQVTCALDYLEQQNIVRCIINKKSPLKEAQLIEGINS